tara:strand:- start:5591 stop:6319 length:729 start_codon:yes stop_codon:yes gene_type:complete
MDLSILNKLFDKVLVLTLEHDFNESDFVANANLAPTAKSRIQRIKDRLDGLDYELFYGIDGSKAGFTNLHTDTNGIVRVMPQNLSFGQIGCSLSHVKMYEKIANSDWEKVLILEDDCIFFPEFENVEDYMSQLPNDWGMVYLGWDGNMYPQPNYSSNICKVTKDNFIHLHCTHSIGITKSFAKTMAEFNKEGYYTADGAFSEVVKQKNETCYAIVPRLTRQENIDCTAYEIDLRTTKENTDK